MPRARRRSVFTVLFRAGTVLALLLVLSPAVWLLAGVVGKAAPHWQWSVLWTNLQGESGGLLGPIVGTLVLMAGVLVIAGSVGVLAGIHLAELSRPKRRGNAGSTWLRMASDVLSGVPSIVLGYVGYVALVVGLHWDFSLLPALLVLSVMVVPYIAKATETALRQVPTSYREGAEALGMSMGHSMRRVVLKSAAPGIVTGLLIALAIAGGETAPLLFTAEFSSTVWTGSFVHAHGFGYLTYLVYQYWSYPSQHANDLSYDAGLILVAMVLLLLVGARVIVARTQRHAEHRGR
jgi:phosphate transport system permease protein